MNDNVAETYEDYKELLLEDLLITALEGGSNYWVASLSWDDVDLTVYEALSRDHVVMVETVDGVECVFTRKMGLDSIDKVKDTHFHVYKQLFKETGDANTADVWFQMAVLGDVIYG